MKHRTMSFENFRVGDYVHFTRQFSAKDFRLFSQLSGDENPLHHDKKYSRNTEYGAPIMPLHLCAAPLSAIAGMMLPGDPSLYAEHNLKALKPVFYGQSLTYSARIAAIAPAQRALTLSVIAFTGTAVVLEAEIIVTARVAEWEHKSEVKIYRASGDKTILITGATGAIGSSVARNFARAGWNLALQYRGDDTEIKNLAKECRGLGVTAWIIRADLEKAPDVKRLASATSKISNLAAFAHSACPPVSGPLDALVAVNYVAFDALVKAGLPAMLCRQSSAVIFVGSTAMDRGLQGWENYTAAKSMGRHAAAALEQSHSRFGVRGLTIAPGFVQSDFSSLYRDQATDALAPEEVADVILELSERPRAAAPYVILEVGRKIQGDYGFHRPVPKELSRSLESMPNPTSAPSRTATVAAVGAEQFSSEYATTALDEVVKRVPKLPGDEDLSMAELGRTSTWDSLSHIALMLEIERALGASFTSEEISVTYSYDGLKNLWLQKQKSTAE